jgi:hypothetical protein
VSDPISNPFTLTKDELHCLLIPGAPHLPELALAQHNLEALRRASQTQILLAETQPLLEKIEPIPALTYSDYCIFDHNGDRKQFETPYFLRRANLTAAALPLFFGQTDLKDIVQDYVWAICEESNWVLPAHENDLIDLFSAETGFLLAELLVVLGDALDSEIRSRVRQEIERRIFDPYLRYHHRAIWWYKSGLNWNGVCNSSVAAIFLLLEPEPGRVARALEITLAGLQAFLDTAFEKDGSSNEGVAYWHYGLINFVALSEMLRARTEGAVDLLASDHLRKIAAFPSKMLLSGSSFATFSDCDETLHFEPGIIARLAERTGETSLLGLLQPSTPKEHNRWFPMYLRDLLWWDGQYHPTGQVSDSYLPLGGTARLTARTPQGNPIVVAIKAGHNDENHNHNDVGSFILHAGDETLLTDPGRGLYTRQYFGPERYGNLFANSYGHSVPRIANRLQKEGHEFQGEFVNVDLSCPEKRAEIEFARAYPIDQLDSARRKITLTETGTVWLQDSFSFESDPVEIEEAFVTWLNVEISGATATIRGNHTLQLIIESPEGLLFEVEALTEACLANAKDKVLKRITVALPLASTIHFRMRLELVNKESQTYI